MRALVVCSFFCMVLGFSGTVTAQETERSDMIIQRMAVKLTRGVTNVGTSVAELPKQVYLTVKSGEKAAFVIGPLKGLGMTLYRAFTGTVETVFFLVPQPGYYDSMIDPEFVWQGWGGPRTGQDANKEVVSNGAASGKKGE